MMTEILDVKKNEEPEAPKDLTWVITVNMQGVVNINGPINDEILTFGVIEKAKDLVRLYNMQRMLSERPKIVKANGIMDFVRKQ